MNNETPYLMLLPRLRKFLFKLCQVTPLNHSRFTGVR